MYWYEDEDKDQTQASWMRVWVNILYEGSNWEWVGCCTEPLFFVYEYKERETW
jgi:hypothetical protein